MYLVFVGWNTCKAGNRIFSRLTSSVDTNVHRYFETVLLRNEGQKITQLRQAKREMEKVEYRENREKRENIEIILVGCEFPVCSIIVIIYSTDYPIDRPTDQWQQQQNQPFPRWC
jgi:hypothetical protein